MNIPAADRLRNAMEATWPAHDLHRVGPWLLREGLGGGKRVSCATTEADTADAAEIAAMETAMRDLGQHPLVMLRPDQSGLDAQLAARGYDLVDPVVLYCAPVALLAEKPAPITLFPVWPILAIMRDLWRAGGIGPERLAIMARAPGPKAAFLARQSDRAAGVAFVACHDGIAMLHALEVAPALRRKGAARNIMRGAAHWAQSQGADLLALAVTRANDPARTLYATLGMQEAGAYHYRQAPQEARQ